MTSPAVKLLAAAGGGSSEPPTITGQLATWWASDLALSDGNSVTAWADRTAAFDLAAESGFEPTYRLSGIGGKPAVDFDGSNDCIGVPNSISTSTDGVVIAVVEWDSVPGSQQQIWTTSADAGNNFRYVMGGAQLSSGTPRVYFEQASNDTADSWRGSTTALANSTPCVIEWSSSGTAYSCRVNNSAESRTTISGSNNGDWWGDALARTVWVLGALLRDSAYSQHFNGKIAYVTLADAELSSGDRTALYDWISDYYGI